MRTALIAFLLALVPATCGLAARDTCLECHAALDDRLQRPATLFKSDVHAAAGLSCADCHGGNRESDDMSVSMNPAKGFVGKVKRAAIPKFCARCHANPELMGKYRPQQRVDQYELYLTSVHGKRLRAGDENVATCIDCHSVHDIRAVKDLLSPVHPLRQADTCARCHADRQKMAKYKLSATPPNDYRSSVHWTALAARGDLSAPACSSCHGNHGAKPPQVSSVAAVCGSCHVLYDQLYEKSVHKRVFSTGAGGGGCIVCHGNHAIHKPSTAMLATPGGVCSQCHETGSPGGQAAAQMEQWINGLDSSLKRSEAVLAAADKYGMEVSEAQVRLLDGRESLVKARLTVHSFALNEVRKPVEAGQAVAKETLDAGQAALREKDMRRLGLAISVVFISAMMVALWLLIRRLEAAKR
jgi:hypothetical protein